MCRIVSMVSSMTDPAHVKQQATSINPHLSSTVLQLDQETHSSSPDVITETSACCYKLTNSPSARAVLGDQPDVSMGALTVGCLGDDDVRCKRRDAASVDGNLYSLDNYDDVRRAEKERPHFDARELSAGNTNKRALRTKNLKIKRQNDQDYTYELGFDSEYDLNQLQAARQLQVRQSDDMLGGRNWRSNMMRVWGRR